MGDSVHVWVMFTRISASMGLLSFVICFSIGQWSGACRNQSGPIHHNGWSISWDGSITCEAQSAGVELCRNMFPAISRDDMDYFRDTVPHLNLKASRVAANQLKMIERASEADWHRCQLSWNLQDSHGFKSSVLRFGWTQWWLGLQLCKLPIAQLACGSHRQTYLHHILHIPYTHR